MTAPKIKRAAEVSAALLCRRGKRSLWMKHFSCSCCFCDLQPAKTPRRSTLRSPCTSCWCSWPPGCWWRWSTATGRSPGQMSRRKTLRKYLRKCFISHSGARFRRRWRASASNIVSMFQVPNIRCFESFLGRDPSEGVKRSGGERLEKTDWQTGR